MSWRVIFVCNVLLCLFKTVQSQDINSVFERIEHNQIHHIQEKLYLHLDKNAYTAGEHIWFKAYNTIGIHNLNSNWSKTAYVELIDSHEKRIDSLIIPLIMGFGIGDFKLTDTITEGSYRIRAYTNYMRNFDDDYFYDRTIHIANGRSDKILSTIELQSSQKDLIYNINFKTLVHTSLQKKRGRYDILFKGKSIKSRTLVTDENGNVSIQIDPKYEGAELIIKLEAEDGKLVKKQYKLLGANRQPSVQVFPDGGTLLANKVNYIGAKSINYKGLGVKSKLVFIQAGDTSAVLETNELGMGGTFVYIDGNKDLEIRAEFDDHTAISVDVPKAQQSGYTIAVNSHNENKIFAQVTVSDDLINNQDIYLVVHHLGEPFFVGKLKVNKDQLLFSVDKSKLPIGITTFSILDEKWMPIIERPVFSYRSEILMKNKVSLDKSTYKNREKVTVSIELGDENDSIRIGSLSASVIEQKLWLDKDRLASNIWSTLWMQADLRGYIESPGYYFQNDQIKYQEIDHVLLTQCWRKLDWVTLDSPATTTHPVEKGQKIAGHIKKIGRQKAEPFAKVNLLSTRNFMDYLDTVANEEGYFAFDNITFPDSVKFLISARDAIKGKNNVDIVMQPQNWAIISSNKNKADELSAVNLQYKDQIERNNTYFNALENIGLMDKSIAIEEVIVRGSTRKKAAENSSNLNGSGNADQILTVDDLMSCPTLEQCLQGRLVGVIWQNGVPINTRSQLAMQIVLDGMYIDADMISSINVFDIESIEVLRNINYTSIYGSYGANGLIIITSNSGAASYNYTPKGILTYQPKGLHLNRTFYKPIYEVESSQTLQNDWRSTIHWEPNIITDEEGRATFDFFTSDAKGTYILIIEGITLDGRLLRKEVEINVE